MSDVLSWSRVWREIRFIRNKVFQMEFRIIGPGCSIWFLLRMSGAPEFKFLVFAYFLLGLSLLDRARQRVVGPITLPIVCWHALHAYMHQLFWQSSSARCRTYHASDCVLTRCARLHGSVFLAERVNTQWVLESWFQMFMFGYHKHSWPNARRHEGNSGIRHVSSQDWKRVIRNSGVVTT